MVLLFLIGPIFVWAEFIAALPSAAWDFTGATIVDVTLTSFFYSASVALAVLAIAIVTAVLWLLEGGVGRAVIVAVMGFAMVSGLLVRNYSWIALFSSKLATEHLPLLYTPGAVVLVMTLVLAPLAFFIVREALKNIPVQAIQAAKTLGVSDFRILVFLCLRSSRRWITLSGLLTFCSSMAYFITPRMIGGQQDYFIGNLIVISVERSGNLLTASALALVLLLSLMPILALIVLVAPKQRRQRVSL
ncbi:MAG: hypothetical protein WDM79_02080 [Terricaulis sp.]